jgi:PPM family protein phosphatase
MKSSSDADTIAEGIVFDSLAEQAAKLFGPTPKPVQVRFGAVTDRGKVRPNNEDHYVVARRRRLRDVLLTNLPDGYLPATHDDAYTMVVADGIGGAAFGELASMLALRAAWDLTTHAFKWHFQITDGEAKELEETMKVYGQLVHRQLLEHAEANPRLAGMGTTLTGGLTTGLDAFFFHLGDSRAYLNRNGSLERLTRDHTLAEHLVDAGAIPSVSEASRVMQNMLVNYLGGHNRSVEVETYRLKLRYGDRLLFCTDGLTDMVREPEIASVLDKHANPQDACNTLVELALDHGGRDNVTVVIARYESQMSDDAGTVQHGSSE